MRAADKYIAPIYITQMKHAYSAFSKFDWDDGNRDQNLKHEVTNGESEQIFFNEPLIVLDDPVHSVAED